MYLPRGQVNGLGVEEPHHPLGRALQVQAKPHRGVAKDGPARYQFRCMEQRRQPRGDQQPIYARGARALRALIRAGRVPHEGGRQFKVRVHQPADKEGRRDRRGVGGAAGG